MADPFEVRLRFTNLLARLSASTTSSLKTAAFALKHRDMDEDLHSCIMENLERPAGGPTTTSTAPSSASGRQTTTSAATPATAAQMNNRANIMYFLEHFCEMAIRENHEAYVEFVRRDMTRIVDSVAASRANVKVVRRVVGTLGDKGILNKDVVSMVEENLKDKEKDRTGMDLLDDRTDDGQFDQEAVYTDSANAGGGGASGGDEDTEMGTGTGTLGEDQVRSVVHGEETISNVPASAHKKHLQPDTHPNSGTRSVPRSGRDPHGQYKPNNSTSNNSSTSVSKADKRAIEQRIEEDRERNKRLREGVWAVNGGPDAGDEFELEKMWDEGSDLSEGDYVIGLEEADERRQFAGHHRALLLR